MATMDSKDVAAFGAAVRAVLERTWPSAVTAPHGDLAKVWQTAAEQGWFEPARGGELAALLTAVRELGRVACPLPLADGFAAVVAMSERPEVVDDIIGGRVRVVAADSSADRAYHVEAAREATHVLTLPADAGRAALREILDVRPTPGMAVPSWSEVTLGAPVAEVDLDAERADQAMVLLRLGLGARALAAAERTHEMAVAHARTRVQFKKVIGSFGAVQQRTATCQIDVTAGNLLLAQAAELFAAGSPEWPLAAEIATAHARRAAPAVQLGAHHTLAAIGYFEEHDAPWLFRRVHADVARLHSLTRGNVADVLVEGTGSLPAFAVGPRGERFREELRAFFADHASTDESGNVMYDEESVVGAMAARGWFGFAWPREYGGTEASLAEQFVLNEEITYGRVPATLPMGSVMLLGNSILRHGTAAQKEHFLPLIRSGKMRFCLGYSEPEVGSDLASVRTRAVRDGDEWVITGQKSWTTGGHQASHVWLAARTDPDASPRHAGITVFLFPMDTPGITVQQHRALSGEISCSVFYDEVRVPDSARVGEVNGGWQVITDALAGERVLMGGIAAALRRQLDDLLAYVRRDPDGIVGPRGSARRARLGEVAVRLQAARALVSAAIGATSAGGGARLEAPMAGVLGGELAEDFGEATLEILGPQAALTGPVPGGGAFEYGLRLSVMYVVGGGTNDIQRGLIARALGLPR